VRAGALFSDSYLALDLSLKQQHHDLQSHCEQETSARTNIMLRR